VAPTRQRKRRSQQDGRGRSGKKRSAIHNQDGAISERRSYGNDPPADRGGSASSARASDRLLAERRAETTVDLRRGASLLAIVT
jgi:hypothetical protein